MAILTELGKQAVRAAASGAAARGGKEICRPKGARGPYEEGASLLVATVWRSKGSAGAGRRSLVEASKGFRGLNFGKSISCGNAYQYFARRALANGPCSKMTSEDKLAAERVVLDTVIKVMIESWSTMGNVQKRLPFAGPFAFLKPVSKEALNKFLQYVANAVALFAANSILGIALLNTRWSGEGGDSTRQSGERGDSTRRSGEGGTAPTGLGRAGGLIGLLRAPPASSPPPPVVIVLGRASAGFYLPTRKLTLEGDEEVDGRAKLTDEDDCDEDDHGRANSK